MVRIIFRYLRLNITVINLKFRTYLFPKSAKMDDNQKPCGSKEKALFLDKFEDVNNFVQQTLRSVLQATKCSNEMPAAGDDFDYYSSYAGFQDAMMIEGKRLLHMIQGILKHQNVKINLVSAGGGAADIDDKFDLLMDANDQMLERVGQWLDEASGIKKQDENIIIASATPKQYTTASWNKKSPGRSDPTPSFKLFSARNIQRPQIKFEYKIDNSRLPFRPILKNKYHAKLSLEESLKLPKGVNEEMTEDPYFLYPHPYKYELENLEYTPKQLENAEPQKPLSLEETPLIHVQTVEELEKMITDLKKQTEIAVDLEHHDYRSFQGFTCLMQISTRQTDYLVDTLSLRSSLHTLNEVFTDPSIVKVLHGAEMDIGWMMRDFGVYIVNMFDTGQAARALVMTRFSLAHLLQLYCSVTADKQFQLADWRIRPLPEPFIKYAREDTHYLLYIYDTMKNELLERAKGNDNMLRWVLKKSTEICSQVYKKPVFTEKSYKDLVLKHKKMFNSKQMKALQDLMEWRDQTARSLDESNGYVLPNHMLLQICDILPRESQGILACCNPIPPIVRQYLAEIFSIIQKARETPSLLVTSPVVKKQTPEQHPRNNVDSLLNCPHDLSHPQVDMDKGTLHTLLDSSLISQQSTVYPELSSETQQDIVVTKKHPFLTVFDYSRLKPSTAGEKKAKEIMSEFSSPYLQFIPDPFPANLQTPENKQFLETLETWKLLQKSRKRKDKDTTEGQSPSSEGPPNKRSKTNLHQEVGKHIRFDDDGQEIEGTCTLDKSVDTNKDRKVSRELEIPLRFQVQTNKSKKKKNRNRDVEIMDAVQKHLSNIRKLHEENEKALGQNVEDEQPVEHIKLNISGKGKISGKRTIEKSKEKEKTNQDDAICVDDSDSDDVKVVKVTENVQMSHNENKGAAESDKKDNLGEAVVIDDSDDDDDSKDGGKTTQNFTPYDYTSGAKMLLEDDKTKKKKDYFNPLAQLKKNKGPKLSKKKGLMQKGSKSLTYRR